MIADLLEAHEESEDQSLATNPIRCSNLVAQFVHRVLIQRGLFAGQLAPGLHLRLLRQVRDHGPVGLQTPQNVRAYEFSQGTVRIVLRCGQAFRVCAELLGRTE